MTSTRSIRFVTAVAVAAFVSWPTVTQAQAPGGRAPLPRQVVSANPFGLMFGWFNVEFERALTPSSTWGASASWFSLDADAFDYVNANAIARYYPSGAALRGFYLGGRGGVYRVSDAAASAVFFGAGFELGYTWLLGAREHVGISLGAGATRLFGGELDGATLTIPTLRLVNVGIAF
jgi:hypothetical protein